MEGYSSFRESAVKVLRCVGVVRARRKSFFFSYFYCPSPGMGRTCLQRRTSDAERMERGGYLSVEAGCVRKGPLYDYRMS